MDATRPSDESRRTYIALEHVLRFLTHGKNMGIPVDSLFEFFDIDLRRDTNKSGYVPGPIWEAIVFLGIEWCKRFGEPLGGIGSSKGLGNSFMGLWGFISEKSETLAEAIDVARTYQILHTDTVLIQTRREPGYLDLILDIQLQNEAVRAHGADFYLSQFDMFIKQCTGEASGIAESVHFQHPAPSDPALLARYQAAFNCPLHFSAPEDKIRIHAGALSAPLVTADPEIQSALKVRAREKIDAFNRQAERNIHEVARKHLRALFSAGKASKEALAERMGLTPRTLLRKLQQSGTTYRALSHDVRLQLARQYLRQPTVPIVFIASLLGFKDPQSFTRWFSEKTGSPPSVFRGQENENLSATG